MSEDSQNLGLLLFYPYRAMENRVIAALGATGHDITLAQSRVFQRIGPNGTRLTELAEQAQITKQTASALVDQLENAGYVQRVPDPHDARARLIMIADRGRAAQPIAAAVVQEVEDEWRRHLGRRNLDRLRELLDRLRQITDPYT